MGPLLVRILQRSRTNSIYKERDIYEEIYNRNWLTWLWKAEKYRDLLPASWRTRKASDTIQSKSEGLRTRSSDVQGKKMDIPAQGDRIHPSSIFLFYVGPQ